MARPRSTYLVATRFEATVGRETQVFASRQTAIAWVASKRGTSAIKETYFRCRSWELHAESFPNPGEEYLLDEWTGVRLSERPFTLTGSDPVALRDKAEARRHRSFVLRMSSLFDHSLIAGLGPEARALARRVVAEYEGAVVDNYSRREQVKEDRRREAAIPTFGSVHDADLERRQKLGRVRPNTAETYRYESASFRKTLQVGGGLVALWDTQVHKLTRRMVDEWFDAFAETNTKFGRSQTTKTLLNVLTRLKAVRDALRRNPDHAIYALALDGVDALLDDVRQSTRDADGWRRRRRLNLKEVDALLSAAATDAEKGVLALLLTGCRAPSEVSSAEWSHFNEDPNGNLWWQVQGRTVELIGKELDQSARTKTDEIDYRQLSIPKKLRALLEPLRGKSRYVLGCDDAILEPSDVSKITNDLLSRAKVNRPGISPYSFRHTVADEVDARFGQAVRDLVLHGQRGTSTGDRHYSHAEKTRRWAQLTFEGKPYGELLPWAS